MNRVHNGKAPASLQKGRPPKERFSVCVCVCIFFFVPTNKKNHVRSSNFTCCRVLFLWSHICINLHVRLHFIPRAAGGKSVLPVGMWTGGAGYRTANIPDFERETPGHSKKARFGVAATVRAHSCCWFSRRHYGNMNECVGSSSRYLTHGLRQTDRRTDGRTDGRSPLQTLCEPREPSAGCHGRGRGSESWQRAA